MTHYIVQIPPRNPDRDPWRLHEVAYRERRHAIAAVQAHRSYGHTDADYIEVSGDYDSETH